MKSVEELRRNINEDLKKIEDNIYQYEKLYLEETIQYGNMLKGWDIYVTMKKSKHNIPKTG